MDRGAWCATVPKVTQSWTRLKQLSTYIPMMCLNQNSGFLPSVSPSLYHQLQTNIPLIFLTSISCITHTGSERGIYVGFVGVEQTSQLGTPSPLDGQNSKKVFIREVICFHCSCSVCFLVLSCFLSICWEPLELLLLYFTSLSKLTTLILESIPQHINYFL